MPGRGLGVWAISRLSSGYAFLIHLDFVPLRMIEVPG